jgi:hypothetical protein
VRLGADRSGRLKALAHVSKASTSRLDLFAMAGTDVTTALYGFLNIAGEERVARVDRNTQGPMRAPPELPYGSNSQPTPVSVPPCSLAAPSWGCDQSLDGAGAVETA